MQIEKCKIILLLIVLFCGLSQGQYIYDESFKDESFIRFKLKFTQAVLDNDTLTLYDMIADSVYKDCIQMDKSSKEYLIKQLRNGLSMWNDRLRKKLLEYTSLGFARYEIGEYHWHHGKIEIRNESVVYEMPSCAKHAYAFVKAENVNIREKPSIESNILKTVSLVPINLGKGFSDQELCYYDKEFCWIKVILPNNCEGYISLKYLFINDQETMVFQKINGEWKIIQWCLPYSI